MTIADEVEGSLFTAASLPYGSDGTGIVVPVGEFALRLAPLVDGVGFPADVADAVSHHNVDRLLRLDRPKWRSVRERIRDLVNASGAVEEKVRAALRPLGEVRPVLPFTVGDYVDFYSSIEHATNLGRLMRPGQEPLLPNWRHLPVGYHGRSSTVVVSGTRIVRPHGQIKDADADAPELSPTRMLDFELEVGFVTGGPENPLGEPVDVDAAEDRIYGLVLVNDWSARDIQAWEYQPLGPFLAKSFATSISPWVVPLEAVEGHRPQAPQQEPTPLSYLQSSRRRGIDLDLEVRVNGAVVTRTNFRDMYWTMAQQLAHMTINGSVVRAGDLYASGTVSGSTEGSQGSLIELTRRGAEPIALDDGSTRTFLQDGDVVAMTGMCGSGRDRVAFGEVVGEVVPAR